MSGPALFPIYVVVGLIIQVGCFIYNNSKPRHLQWSTDKTIFLAFVATLVANFVVLLTLRG